jgi:[acyl-carrier-protein] S-malonyltransferase
MKTCFLFPGQGAQYPAMGKDLWQASQMIRELFEAASDYTGMDVKRLLFEGSEEELKETDKTQVAVTLVNLSASIVAKEHGIQAQGYAGFSLGEYSALSEAGVIDLDILFPIVKARGEFMEIASRSTHSADGQAGMAAIIGLTKEQVIQVLGSLKSRQVFLANHNSPTQVVLSGAHEGLKEAEEALKNAGAKRVIRLRVSGPFHSPLMSKAAGELEAFLKDYTFHNPAVPVYSNTTAQKISSAAEAKELCVKQVVSPVLWVDEEQTLLKDGFNSFYETGPGSVLCGLWKALGSEYPCLGAGKLADIQKQTSKE